MKPIWVSKTPSHLSCKHKRWRLSDMWSPAPGGVFLCKRGLKVRNHSESHREASDNNIRHRRAGPIRKQVTGPSPTPGTPTAAACIHPPCGRPPPPPAEPSDHAGPVNRPRPASERSRNLQRFCSRPPPVEQLQHLTARRDFVEVQHLSPSAGTG